MYIQLERCNAQQCSLLGLCDVRHSRFDTFLVPTDLYLGSKRVVSRTGPLSYIALKDGARMGTIAECSRRIKTSYDRLCA